MIVCTGENRLTSMLPKTEVDITFFLHFNTKNSIECCQRMVGLRPQKYNHL